MITFEQVRSVICAELGLPKEDVQPFTKLVTLMDSLERASLILELENSLHIEIPEDEAQEFFHIQDILDYAGKCSVGAY